MGSRTENAATPVLVTFPPMIDAEMARFVLTHYGVAFREEPHILGISSLVSLWYGQSLVLPLFYAGSTSVAGTRPIIDHFDPLSPAERRLIPAEATAARQVAEDWTLFYDSLAGAAAALAYYHLLPHRAIMIDPLSRGAPAWEVGLVAKGYGVFAAILRLALQLNPDRVVKALDQVRAVFDQVDRRLADGRRTLIGDGLTLSDVAFAVYAAPLVLPDDYGGPIPRFDQMPTALQALISETRARPCGAFAQRIYREERNRRPETPLLP